MNKTRSKLIKLLQRAHAGEHAAALAYNGHWRSLKDAAEIAAIRKVETDEWEHRAKVAEMLAALGAKPLAWRECLFFLIGRAVAFTCHFCGRFCSTYFAGVLEKDNVAEYRAAFEYAAALRLDDFAADFRAMELAEAEHEIVLQKMIREHPWLPFFAFFFGWGNDRICVLPRQKAKS